MLSVLSENPSIKAKELVLKVHQKNAQTANMLTRISQMYDIKGDPNRHGQYLIMLLRTEEIAMQISNLKAQFRALPEGEKKDSIFKTLNDLQKQQIEFKKKANELI